MAKKKDVKIPKTKVCTACHVEKFAKSFYRNYKSDDGLTDECRSCRAKTKRKEKELKEGKPVITGQFVPGMSGNPNGRPKKGPAIERVAKKVFGERLVKHRRGTKWNNLTEEEITGNEAVLTYLALYCLDEASKRDKRDILMWWGNKMNANPKETKEVTQKISIEKEIADDVQDMIDKLVTDIEAED